MNEVNPGVNLTSGFTLCRYSWHFGLVVVLVFIALAVLRVSLDKLRMKISGFEQKSPIDFCREKTNVSRIRHKKNRCFVDE